MSTKKILSIALAAALGAVLLAGPATAASIGACSEAKTEGDKPVVKAHCDIRGVLAGGPESVSSEPPGAAFQSYTDNPKDAATLILIDRSKSLKGDAFERLRKVASGLLEMEVQAGFGVATFGSDYKIFAPLGADPKLTEAALKSLKNDGNTTELLSAVSHAIEDLKASKHLRLSIVVLSDGIPEDSAYPIAEIIDKAKAANIRVFGVIPGASDRAKTEAQSLRRLADETDGQFWALEASSDSQSKAVEEVADRLTEGGTASFVVQATETKLKASFTGGETQEKVFKSALYVEPPADQAKAENTKAEPLPPIHDVRSLWLHVKFRLHEAKAWVLAKTWRMAATGIVILALLAGIISLLRRRGERHQPTHAVHLDPPLAYLEYLDAAGTKEPIYKRSSKIGRASDNDICINNTSVHRYHAVLTSKSPDKFEITDLATQNGTLVNGHRVSTQELSNGDVIELGEVRARFSLLASQ